MSIRDINTINSKTTIAEIGYLMLGAALSFVLAGVAGMSIEIQSQHFAELSKHNRSVVVVDK